jgi:hypothetical protein
MPGGRLAAGFVILVWLGLLIAGLWVGVRWWATGSVSP